MKTRLLGAMAALALVAGVVVAVPSSAGASSALSSVFDAGTNTAWSGTETVGATAYDTVVLTGDGSVTPTGAVSYTLYTGGTCSGAVVFTDSQPIQGDGSVPNSATTQQLGAGGYSFLASYPGDANNGPAASPCAAFSVGKVTPNVNTIAQLSGGTATGASAFDTASFSGVVGGFTPSGSVSYALYTNGSCSGSPNSTGNVNVGGGGNIPNSSTTGPLGGGAYSYEATYGGDGNYTTASGACEPFSVAQATPSLGTTVVVAGTASAWGGSRPVGTSAQDTAVVGGVGGFTPSGTVTYAYYVNGGCTGGAVTATVPLGGGAVPPSNATGPLANGTYSFLATYSGDANYTGISSSCEPFSVASGTGTTTFSSIVNDASANVPWTGLEATGATAAQNITVSGVGGITPTGSVGVALFTGATCTGTVVGLWVGLPLTGGAATTPASAPLGAGSYSYLDTYNGDTNYASATSQCSTFTVAKGTPSINSTVYNAATSQPWPPNPSPGSGAKAYDTSSVTQAASVTAFPPTGTVTYEFFTTPTGGTPCTGTPTSTQVVNLATGTTTSSVPNSATTGTLNRGSYAFEALYSGDSNWSTPLSGDCQTLNVGIGTPNTPSITNIPGSPVEFNSFQANVSTNGDGPTSVTSDTTNVCTVGPDGHTVTFVLYGACSLTAFVGVGNNYGAGTGNAQAFGVVHAPRGYWLVGSDGGIFSFGSALFHGSMGGTPLQRPVVGITPAAGHGGYWLVATDGGVFSFGPNFYGSIPGIGLHPAGSGQPNSLNAPIVGIVPSITQHGYFMVATDGGVFAFGDAHFAGSCPGIGGCAGSAVAVMPDRSGNGYWLVTNQGYVYAFGDARYYGASRPFGVPCVDAVATPDGGGYWILYANGTVLSYGDASPLGAPLGYVNQYNPATAIFPTADGHGYWVSAARGDVFSYGNAIFYGGMAATNLNGAIIAADGF